MHFADYNFRWPPRHTDYSGKAGRLHPTPTMAGGVTNRLWKFDDLCNEVSARIYLGMEGAAPKKSLRFRNLNRVVGYVPAYRYAAALGAGVHLSEV